MGVPVQTAFSRARLEAVEEVAASTSEARARAEAKAAGNPAPGVSGVTKAAEEEERAINEREREKAQGAVEGSQVREDRVGTHGGMREGEKSIGNEKK